MSTGSLPVLSVSTELKTEISCGSILPCRICEFETRTKATLDEHIKSNHEQPKNVKFTCDKCRKEFDRRLALDHHKCSPPVTKYPCDYKNCAFESEEIPGIVRHINEKQRRTIHACQHCDYEAEDKFTLNDHIKVNHQQL